MSEKYQNKYRIPSARLQAWDYRWAAAYFITVCTQNREPYFGEIKNGQMILSGAGILADVFWHEIKQHAAGIELGEFEVMPNHIHEILILNDSANGVNENDSTADGINSNIELDNGNGDDNKGNDNVIDNVNVNDNVIDNVETRHALSLQSQSQSELPQKQRQQQSQSQPQQSIPPLQSKSQTPSNSESHPPKTIGQQRFQNQEKNSVSSLIGSYKSAVTKHANRLQLPMGWQPRFHDHIIRNAEEYKRIEIYIQNNVVNWKEDRFYNA